MRGFDVQTPFASTGLWRPRAPGIVIVARRLDIAPSREAASQPAARPGARPISRQRRHDGVWGPWSQETLSLTFGNYLLARGALAQLGEHLLCKQGVIGSIPIGSTKLYSPCGFPRWGS